MKLDEEVGRAIRTAVAVSWGGVAAAALAVAPFVRWIEGDDGFSLNHMASNAFSFAQATRALLVISIPALLVAVVQGTRLARIVAAFCLVLLGLGTVLVAVFETSESRSVGVGVVLAAVAVLGGLIALGIRPPETLASRHRTGVIPLGFSSRGEPD